MNPVRNFSVSKKGLAKNMIDIYNYTSKNKKKGISNGVIFGILFLGFCLLSGCGYSLKSALPSNIRYINISPFKNKIDIGQQTDDYTRYISYRPMMETDITKAVISAFISDGSLKIATYPEDADLLLEGNLIAFVRQPLQYDINDNVREYRLNIVVQLILRAKNKKILWEESRFIGDATYKTEGIYTISEATALDNAVNDLAKRIVERVIEDW